MRTLNDAGLLDIPDGTSLNDVPDMEPLDSLVLYDGSKRR